MALKPKKKRGEPVSPLPRTLDEFWTAKNAEEEALLRKTFEREDWGMSAAARALEVSPSTLQRVLSRHPKLEAEQKKNAPSMGESVRRSWERRRSAA